MKILFVRHGESVDDLTNQYGGWADFPLTPKGYLQLEKTVNKISNLKIKFDIVLTSPLQRAVESGRIIANLLSIPQKNYLYLKEKNGYGLLSGMNKEKAQKEYPELFKAELEGGYVLGSETKKNFLERVKTAVSKIQKMNYNNVISVTHGGFMTQLFNEILKKKYIKAYDGGFILLKSKDNGNFDIELVDGIDYEDE